MISNLLIVLALLAFAGIVVCFRGQKMLAMALAILAFVFTYQFLSVEWGASPTGIVAALAVSVVAVLLVSYAQSIAFFLVGFLTGILIGNIAVGFLPAMQNYIHWVIILCFALILGFLSRHYQKQIIRILTGICGGYFLAVFTLLLIVHIDNLGVFEMGNIMDTATSLITYMSSSLLQDQPLLGLVLTVIYSICGILYQRKHH